MRVEGHVWMKNNKDKGCGPSHAKWREKNGWSTLIHQLI